MMKLNLNLNALGVKAIGAAALVLTLAVAPGWANDDVPDRPTFTKDVLPILQEECQTCHRPLGANLSGMVAPMSFMTYREIRPWAKAISKVVESKEMPPWHATKKTHGHFSNERTLTDVEIATLVRWVETGAARGNPADAPTPVQFPETGWNFGVPDLVIEFGEPFLVGDDVEDLYHNVTVQISEEQLPEDRWIKAIEFRPGSEVVHHIIGYAAAGKDAVDASAQEGAITRGMLGGMAPGTEEARFPDGYGVLLQRGSNITFAMHYHKEAGAGTARWDTSGIGVQFYDDALEVDRPVEWTNFSHGNFEVPPGHANWRVGGARFFEQDTMLLSMMPHLHLRGAAAKYTAFYPDGTQEVILDVPQYDFNWQTSYNYTTTRLIPAGTRLEMEFIYDNSKENADRVGFNAERAIRFGGPTTDEMDLAWITIAPAQANPVATRVTSQEEASD